MQKCSKKTDASLLASRLFAAFLYDECRGSEQLCCELAGMT